MRGVGERRTAYILLTSHLSLKLIAVVDKNVKLGIGMLLLEI